MVPPLRPAPRLSPLSHWAIAASVVAAMGCAAGARQGASPSKTKFAPEGPTPTTIDGAVADIDRWRQVLGVPDTNARAGFAQATPTTPPPPPPTAAAPPTTYIAPLAPADADAAEESKSAATEADTTTTAAPPPACVTPCKAIASMRRSVDALCRLAGEADARCVDARGTLERSEQKVARCGC